VVLEEVADLELLITLEAVHKLVELDKAEEPMAVLEEMVETHHLEAEEAAVVLQLIVQVEELVELVELAEQDKL
jgi:hypothetical protein